MGTLTLLELLLSLCCLQKKSFRASLLKRTKSPISGEYMNEILKLFKVFGHNRTSLNFSKSQKGHRLVILLYVVESRDKKAKQCFSKLLLSIPLAPSFCDCMSLKENIQKFNLSYMISNTIIC